MAYIHENISHQATKVRNRSSPIGKEHGSAVSGIRKNKNKIGSMVHSSRIGVKRMNESSNICSKIEMVNE